MSSPRSSLQALAALSLCVAVVRGQAQVARTFVTPAGELVECTELELDLAQEPPPSSVASAAGVTWTLADNGLGWIGTAVALGGDGGQVFTELHKNAIAALLCSSFDADPPVPIWSHPEPLTEARKVVSADGADSHVVIHELVLGGLRQAEVVARSSHSPAPRWRYTFPSLITTGSDVGIARDGSVIVAAISNDAAGRVEVAVLDPDDGSVLSYTPVSVAAPLRSFDLAAGGALLLFTAGTRAYVFDVALAAVVFSSDVATGLDAAAISGDGRVLAFGGYNWMRVWERSGSIWSPTFTRFVPGSNYVSALDVSADGSTIAYGFSFYDTFLTVRVEALDVALKVVTMSDHAVGAGALQNMVSDVAICGDGSRFAVGTWGEASGSVHELRYYSRSLGAPLAAIDLPGSVYDVDISADGRRVAAAGKALHANALGNGGRIVLFDAGGADIALSGAPRIGTTPTFEVWGTPGKPAWLLASEGLASTPFAVAGGEIVLDRDRMEVFAMGRVAATGEASLPFPLAPLPAMVGVTLYFQGLTSPPLAPTKEWLAITILP